MKEKDISDRKKEHIELTKRSQMSRWSNDKRFFYEPLLGTHPGSKDLSIDFFKKKLKYPIWVSSMTGGTKEAKAINENLARACEEFGLGMGLGSCRPLLEDPKKYIEEFAVRTTIGDKQVLCANLGIAQIEKSIDSGEVSKIEDMVGLLDADGLIVHVNPLQEWIQEEGDKISRQPLDTIKELLEQTDIPLIVKEVGQGMGPKSLNALMQLPIVIEFGAYGGTNFSQLELNRRSKGDGDEMSGLANIGHNVDEMLDFFLEEKSKLKTVSCKGLIISGGVKNYLDGYYAVQKAGFPAVYGQASAFLNVARKPYAALQDFVRREIEGYKLATELLTIR